MNKSFEFGQNNDKFEPFPTIERRITVFINALIKSRQKMQDLVNDTKGASAVEYAMLVGLVSIIVVLALVVFGPKIEAFVDGINFG